MTNTTLRPGEQLASAVCTTRVVVVRAPGADAPEILCGGSPMVSAASAPAVPSTGGDPVTLVGKRYVDVGETIELLCTSSGSGELTIDGVALTLKAAKALPASD